MRRNVDFQISELCRDKTMCRKHITLRRCSLAKKLLLRHEDFTTEFAMYDAFDKSTIWRHGSFGIESSFEDKLWRSWGCIPKGPCRGFDSHAKILPLICQFPAPIAHNALQALAFYFKKEGREVPADVEILIEALQDFLNCNEDGHLMKSFREYVCGNFIIWRDESTRDGKSIKFSAYGAWGYGPPKDYNAAEAAPVICNHRINTARSALDSFITWVKENHPGHYNDHKESLTYYSELINAELWTQPYPPPKEFIFSDQEVIGVLLNAWAHAH